MSSEWNTDVFEGIGVTNWSAPRFDDETDAFSGNLPGLIIL